ncbi:hypothetical protein [Peribacillus asahii]|uniref:hypothetical protein n=1 Tax=Peribacillus asahii TaxID=228899 RepID=UPI00381E1485
MKERTRAKIYAKNIKKTKKNDIIFCPPLDSSQHSLYIICSPWNAIELSVYLE